MVDAIWVPRHRRSSSYHRCLYLDSRWPARTPRDLLEIGGTAANVGIAVGIVGLIALASSLALGDASSIAAILNLAVIVCLALIHCVNAVRCRRRRSVLVGPVAVLTSVLAIIDLHGRRYLVADWWTQFGLMWGPAALADLVFPRWIYLARPRPKVSERTHELV